MGVDEWIEEQLRNAPPLPEAVGRRVKRLMWPDDTDNLRADFAEANEERAARNERERAERFRLRDSRGLLVVVDDGLTYRWTGPDRPAVGDVVVVPPMSFRNGLQRAARNAVVASLGSDYDGKIADLIGSAS